MPFSIKPMFPVRTLGTVGEVVIFAVDTLECMWTGFVLLGFWYRWICVRVLLTAPCHLSVVFELVRSAALLASSAMYSACICGMTPFPAVFTLWYSRVHVSASEDGYVTPKIETPVDKSLGFCAALRVPDINPYYGHIRFGRHSNNTGT